MNNNRYSGNNYVRNITFANAGKKPVYMQVLRAIAKAKKPVSRADVVMNVWGEDLAMKSKGWNCGPFTLLRQNGYVDYDKNGWRITPKGRLFLAEHWSWR